LAGTSKLEIDENRVWVLVRVTLDQLFDRAAKHPWRRRYTLSADVKQHKEYVGTTRLRRFTLSEDPQAMTAYDGSPGGITDAHSALPLELRMRALGLHEAANDKSQ
jgi:hypothetical protein